MSYVVTYGNSPAPGPIAIIECEDIPRALACAHQLLFEGKPNVAIGDGKTQISGNELIECCNETKKITDDFKVVPV